MQHHQRLHYYPLRLVQDQIVVEIPDHLIHDMEQGDWNYTQHFCAQQKHFHQTQPEAPWVTTACLHIYYTNILYIYSKRWLAAPGVSPKRSQSPRTQPECSVENNEASIWTSQVIRCHLMTHHDPLMQAKILSVNIQTSFYHGILKCHLPKNPCLQIIKEEPAETNIRKNIAIEH